MKNSENSYPTIKAQQSLVFMAIPKGRPGGNLTDTDQSRLQVLTRRVRDDILLRTMIEVGNHVERGNQLMKNSRIIDTRNCMDISTTCGIIYSEVAKSGFQIKEFEPCGEGASGNSGQFLVLESFIRDCFPIGALVNGSPSMFTWIPVKMQREERGVLADVIYSYPIHRFLKEVFPDASQGVDFIKLMRLCHSDDPHAIVVYPGTERVVLMTEFTTEKL
jgi:hypothetical protein